MVPLFLMIVGLMKHGLDTIEYLCCSVIVLLQALAAFRYRIDLHDDKLIYTTLFSGSITIPFSMIESVTHGTTDDRYKPPIRLEIKPVTGTPHRPFYINLKIFRLQDIRVLFQVFEEKGLKVK